MMNLKFAERIASNVARVKRLHGATATAKWWEARFPHMDPDDYNMVVDALRRRSGQPPPPAPPTDVNG